VLFLNNFNIWRSVILIKVFEGNFFTFLSKVDRILNNIFRIKEAFRFSNNRIRKIQATNIAYLLTQFRFHLSFILLF